MPAEVAYAATLAGSCFTELRGRN